MSRDRDVEAESIGRGAARVAVMCAATGAALLVVGTSLHPMHADPNDPAAAFAEYAANHIWLASHLTQFCGMALVVGALLSLAHHLKVGGSGVSPRFAAAGAICTLSLGGALQAVDGIALKAMVDAWAAASAPEKDVIFYAALAVRQLEIGLASIVSIVFGITALLYSAALRADPRYPNWSAALGAAGGLMTAFSGIVMGATGFSDMSMWLNMPGMSILLVWIVAVALVMRRVSRV